MHIRIYSFVHVHLLHRYLHRLRTKSGQVNESISIVATETFANSFDYQLTFTVSKCPCDTATKNGVEPRWSGASRTSPYKSGST